MIWFDDSHFLTDKQHNPELGLFPSGMHEQLIISNVPFKRVLSQAPPGWCLTRGFSVLPGQPGETSVIGASILQDVWLRQDTCSDGGFYAPLHKPSWAYGQELKRKQPSFSPPPTFNTTSPLKIQWLVMNNQGYLDLIVTPSSLCVAPTVINFPLPVLLCHTDTKYPPGSFTSTSMLLGFSKTTC